MDRRPPNYRNNMFDDGDIDDATFLKYSGRSSYSDDQDALRQKMLQEKREIETRTLASTQRSLQLLNDSEHVGSATAVELSHQREQLENTEQKLDDINASLRISEKHIQSIKSVFGSIKNYFSGANNKMPPSSGAASTSKDTDKDGGDITRSKSDLAQVLHATQQSTAATLQSQRDRERDFDYGQSSASDMKSSVSVDEMLDKNLEDMSAVLGRLKGLGRDLGTEIESQNNLIERITVKSEDADFRMTKQSKDMNKILKR